MRHQSAYEAVKTLSEKRSLPIRMGAMSGDTERDANQTEAQYMVCFPLKFPSGLLTVFLAWFFCQADNNIKCNGKNKKAHKQSLL